MTSFLLGEPKPSVFLMFVFQEIWSFLGLVQMFIWEQQTKPDNIKSLHK